MQKLRFQYANFRPMLRYFTSSGFLKNKYILKKVRKERRKIFVAIRSFSGLFCARKFDGNKRHMERWNRKILTKSIRKVDLQDRRWRVAEDWSVPLKIVPKMRGHWPFSLPPRECTSYIEHLTWNFIFRTESQCQGSPPESNKVSTVEIGYIYRYLHIFNRSASSI